MKPFWNRPDYLVWKLSVPPRSGPEVIARIEPRGDSFHYYDWGGGLVWLAIGPSPDATDMAVRGALEACGGHATLVRAPETLRAAIPVFQPQDAAKAALTRRVKDGFDPRRILNPGRLEAGL